MLLKKSPRASIALLVCGGLGAIRLPVEKDCLPFPAPLCVRATVCVSILYVYVVCMGIWLDVCMYVCRVIGIDKIGRLSTQCMSTAYVSVLSAKQGVRKYVLHSFKASKFMQVYNLFIAGSKLCLLHE